jgi:HSP20 family protein
MESDKRTDVAVRERKWPSALAWPEDVERFFGRAFRSPWLSRRRLLWPALRREAAWMPDMDVFDREGKTVVRLDLPGMKREDLDVSVEGDMLVVRGKREESTEVKEENYYCSERATGEFSRAISLPEGLKTEDIEATYQDGVLEVVMPNGPTAAESPSVKIAVK